MILEPCNVLFLLYIFCLKVITSNSKITLWKLNSDRTKIIEVDPFSSVPPSKNHTVNRDEYYEDDALFDIIISTEHYGQSWVKQDVGYYCSSCQRGEQRNANNPHMTDVKQTIKTNNDDILDCGMPISSTVYDSLMGIKNRNQHQNELLPILYPDNHDKKGSKETELFAILKKIKREKQKSVQLYNQIGNFWRLKGNATRSIECFRKALGISPNSSEVLLNLARVLFSLRYWDDAIFLTNKSLEIRTKQNWSVWQEYFLLGEIYKAYGHYTQASIYFNYTLELNPHFKPADDALKDIKTMTTPTVHIFILVIIVCLVLTKINVNKYGEGGFILGGSSPFVKNKKEATNRILVSCFCLWIFGMGFLVLHLGSLVRSAENPHKIGLKNLFISWMCCHLQSNYVVLGVLLVILSSVDNVGDYTDEIKPQRHFNKAMAMRSLKRITMTAKRCKKST